MLASTSVRGLRERLTQGFGKLFELNLNGGVNEISAGAENDENVFDIAQAVAVHVYVRSMGGSRSETINYADFWGRRSAKYAACQRKVESSYSLQSRKFLFLPFAFVLR